MKIRITLLFLLINVSVASAQTFRTYDDTHKILTIYKHGKAMTAPEALQCLALLKPYLPQDQTSDVTTIQTHLAENPMFKIDGDFLIQLKAGLGAQKKAMEAKDVGEPDPGIAAAVTGTSTTSSVFSASGIADVLAQLIIQRAKEELTVAFFERLKKALQANPELIAAFPKTSTFIGQIESESYTSFLPALREAFNDDINNLAFQVGAILQTPRIKAFIEKYQLSADIWRIVPLLRCAGDLRRGASIPDAVKDLYPDSQLATASPDYYRLLKLAVILSESVRDASNNNNWLKGVDLDNFITGAAANKTIFFALLYEQTMEKNKAGVYYCPVINAAGDNTKDIQDWLKAFADAYNGTNPNDLYNAYLAIKMASKAGKPLTYDQVITLINNAEKSIQGTFDGLKTLAKFDQGLVVVTDDFFKAYPQLIVILGNFHDKHYASGVMNTLQLLNQYVSDGTIKFAPFKDLPYLDVSKLTDNNLKDQLAFVLTNLQSYQKIYPDDDIKGLIKDLNALIAKTTATVDDANKLYAEISKHDYKYSGYAIYQQILKYGSLMASLSTAKTPAEASAALDATILPVGSSAIKYYSLTSISINSYIGAAYYGANYQMSGTGSPLQMHTLGVALPIGPNFSISTKGSFVGAFSLFVPVIDLGTVASYRLNTPADSQTQTLPQFTFQNLLAPGAFLVFNRLFKTPLAIGVGTQRAPQLDQIQNGTATFNTNPQWRFGAFLSVDIPLFNLYSTPLKKPIK